MHASQRLTPWPFPSQWSPVAVGDGLDDMAPQLLQGRVLNITATSSYSQLLTSILAAAAAQLATGLAVVATKSTASSRM